MLCSNSCLVDPQGERVNYAMRIISKIVPDTVAALLVG